MSAGVSWQFHHWILHNNSLITNYTERRWNDTTHYPSGLYEKNISTNEVTKYYYAGGKRIAERKGGTLYYLLSDHLGSTSTVVDANGNNPKNNYYFSYGATRQNNASAITDNLYTGQKFDTSINMYWYGSRMYDQALGRFISPDSIVPNPGNPQALNRYSYVYNNPLKYIDPTGHYVLFIGGMGTTYEEQRNAWKDYINDETMIWENDPYLIDHPDDPRERYGFFNWEDPTYGTWSSTNRPVGHAVGDVDKKIANAPIRWAGEGITIIGHSKGGALGAAYVDYLTGLPSVMGNQAKVNYLVTLDSPLDGRGIFVGYEDYYRVDHQLSNLSERAREKGLQVTVITVDNPSDIVGHDPIGGSVFDVRPHFGNSIDGWNPFNPGKINEIHGKTQGPIVASWILPLTGRQYGRSRIGGW